MYWYSPRVRHWVKREGYLRGYQEELVEGPFVVGNASGWPMVGGCVRPARSWPASC